jgi:hypothetical protein
MNFDGWRSFESCRSLVPFNSVLSLSYSISSVVSGNEGEEGSLFSGLVWQLRLTHEGGARHDVSPAGVNFNTAGFKRFRNANQRTITQTNEGKSERIERRAVQRGYSTGTWGHSYRIQEGRVCPGRLRSSYLLKNGPKVTLSEFE